MNIWAHGKYFDLWSLVHLLSGVALAFLTYGLGHSFVTAAVISIGALIAWELFEWVVGIIEPSVNVGVDLIVGALGFFAGAYWHYGVGHPYDPVIFGACLFFLFGLSLWGFLDFYFRGYH